MANVVRKTERVLRLSISVYAKGTNVNRAERHDWAVNNHVAQAAKVHAKHGIKMYQQVFTPPSFQEVAKNLSDQAQRNWTIDDHDATVEFYFTSFADMAKVSADPEWLKLQAEEEPYVERERQRVSLGWVERYIDDGKVVNFHDGKSTYATWEEASDLSTAFPQDGQ